MTTYYIDAKRGSDLNAGTSKSAAWQNPSMIPTITAPGPGDQFLLASDSRWVPSHTSRVVMPVGCTGIEANPVIIDKYDPDGVAPGGKPTIVWNRETVASDWTETASPGCWVYANAGSYQFTNSCLMRLADSWMASCVDTCDTAAEIAASGVPGRYFATGTTLWLYSPAGVNPVTYYGKVVVSPAASGYFTFSSGRKWITIRNIHFEDTSCGVLFYSGSSAEVGFRAQGISGRRVSNLIGANADATGVLRAWIHDCDIRDFGSLAIVSAVNGDGIRQLEIYNNRIDEGVRCWAQAGIYLTCRSAGFAALVYNNHLSRCAWGTRDKNVDGCAIYCETKSDNSIVFGNVVHDCYTAFQDNSGRKAVFTGNLVYNCRLAMRVTDQALVGSSDHQSYNNTFLIGDMNQQPSQWGGTQGEQYPGYWCFSNSGTLKLTVKNNIIANVGTGRARAAFGLPQSHATNALDGNWLYGFENDTENTVSFAQTVLTKLGTTDPRPYLDAVGRLKRPYLVGEITMLNPLGGAGAYVQGVRLQDGKRLDPTRVPVGACAEVMA